MIRLKSAQWFHAAVSFGILTLPVTASATFSVILDAGYLRQNAGTALNSSTGGGALLLLVAAGGGSGPTAGQVFTNTPGAGQYVSGGDVVLGAQGFNANVSTSGTGKETQNTFATLTLPSTTTSSAYIELRWYPGITLAQYNAGVTPTAGMVFGAYNPLVTNSSGNTTLNPDGGNLWSLPANGSGINLNFFTTDDPPGTQTVSEGFANFVVPVATVPEPSAGILGGLALVMMVGAHTVRRRSKIA